MVQKAKSPDTTDNGNRPFRYFVSLPPVRFATTLDHSLPGCFATCTVH